MSFLTLTGPARAELEAKRSRFIANASFVATELEASDHRRRLRNEFPDATHHCWAYVLGDPQNSTALKAEDDQEPSGTAGKPILSVLLRKNVGYAQVIVVRYYGGTKLGASGLVRAYSNAATRVLDQSGLIQHVNQFRARVLYPYEFDAKLKRALADIGIHWMEPDYGSDVTLSIQGPEELWGTLPVTISELTNGRARIERTDS